MAENITEVVISGEAISEVTSTEAITESFLGTMAGITDFMVDFIRLPITAAIIHMRMARIASFAAAPFGRLTVTEFAVSASACKQMLFAARIHYPASTRFTDCAVKRTSSWIGTHSSLELRAKTCAEDGNRASVSVIGGVRNELIVKCQA